MIDKLERIDLKPGQVVSVNGKLYGRCGDCGDIVRLNKWIIGSLHLCVAPEERRR